MPALSRVGALGRVTSAGLAGANPWLALLVVVEPVALALALVARAGAPPDRAG